MSFLVRFLFISIIAVNLTTVARAETAVFAGGCFWCMEAAYQDVDGVTDVVSGFTGGTLQNPTYKGNHDGHYEAVKVSFDPKRISYEKLLNIFWKNIDPFDARGQFCDKGFSYQSAIFPQEGEQEALAKNSLNDVVKQFNSQKIATVILPAGKFWPVEESHQDYYKKNPIRYSFYRRSCGRDARLKEIWGEAPH